MSKTEKNLQNAFAGESQANRKYLAYAKKAEEDGYKQIAKLFRATAEAETVHAMNHLKTSGGIKSTKENLKAAINAVEKIHAELYKKALENLGSNPDVDHYVCQVCGNTVEGEPPDKCPICGALKKMFKKVK
jgi:rubrerythrin